MTITLSYLLLTISGVLSLRAWLNWSSSREALRDARELRDRAVKTFEETKASGEVMLARLVKSLDSAKVHADGGCDCEDEDHKHEAN